MEIQYHGANCIRVSTKKASIVIDDKSGTATKNGDIVIFTDSQNLKKPKQDVKTIIEQPGEYEVSDTSIQGVAARAHMDEPGTKQATMFKIIGDDIRLVAVGHVYPELNDEQLEALGTVDVLVIPVGGHGYTLDALGALKLIKKIEPKIIIPTHYADKTIKYEVPQSDLAEALKELSMEPKETVPKLKLKASELFGSESNQLIVLERQ